MSHFTRLRVLKRDLHANEDGKTSKSPFLYDPNVLGTLRPDQVPRFFGTLTDSDKLPTKDVNLSDLHAMQDRVDHAKVKAIAEAEPNPDAKLPVVVKHAGKQYIADGHHRLAAAWLNGDTTAKVHFKDLTPVTQAMKGDIVDGDSSHFVGLQKRDAPEGSTYASVRKMNPNHGPDGKFTSAGGGSGGDAKTPDEAEARGRQAFHAGAEEKYNTAIAASAAKGFTTPSHEDAAVNHHMAAFHYGEAAKAFAGKQWDAGEDHMEIAKGFAHSARAIEGHGASSMGPGPYKGPMRAR